jgi:hypothetical protein
MTNDYIYWTFSAASQSISAFIAFLLTGYALVHSMMESAHERDDSLEEVHASLKASHHRSLCGLAWLTGSAIVLSLVVVYLNRSNAAVSVWWQGAVALVNLAAVVGGLWFVVSIVDPSKYEKAAKKVLHDAPIPVSGTQAPASEFFAAFLHLERLVRDYLRERELYVPSRGAPQMSYSFRQMLEALLENEKIDRAFYEELLEINKYRNLVFHGHVHEASAAMVKRVQDAAAKVEQLT